jgi:hypothetical protein
MNKVLYSVIQYGEMQYGVIIIKLSLMKKIIIKFMLFVLGKTGTVRLATVGY